MRPVVGSFRLHSGKIFIYLRRVCLLEEHLSTIRIEYGAHRRSAQALSRIKALVHNKYLNGKLVYSAIACDVCIVEGATVAASVD
jgi:hypothetical protein